MSAKETIGEKYHSDMEPIIYKAIEKIRSHVQLENERAADGEPDHDDDTCLTMELFEAMYALVEKVAADVAKAEHEHFNQYLGEIQAKVEAVAIDAIEESVLIERARWLNQTPSSN